MASNDRQKALKLGHNHNDLLLVLNCFHLRHFWSSKSFRQHPKQSNVCLYITELLRRGANKRYYDHDAFFAMEIGERLTLKLRRQLITLFLYVQQQRKKK